MSEEVTSCENCRRPCEITHIVTCDGLTLHVCWICADALKKLQDSGHLGRLVVKAISAESGSRRDRQGLGFAIRRKSSSGRRDNARVKELDDNENGEGIHRDGNYVCPMFNYKLPNFVHLSSRMKNAASRKRTRRNSAIPMTRKISFPKEDQRPRMYKAYQSSKRKQRWVSLMPAGET